MSVNANINKKINKRKMKMIKLSQLAVIKESKKIIF